MIAFWIGAAIGGLYLTGKSVQFAHWTAENERRRRSYQRPTLWTLPMNSKSIREQRQASAIGLNSAAIAPPDCCGEPMVYVQERSEFVCIDCSKITTGAEALQEIRSLGRGEFANVRLK